MRNVFVIGLISLLFSILTSSSYAQTCPGGNGDPCCTSGGPFCQQGLRCEFDFICRPIPTPTPTPEPCASPNYCASTGECSADGGSSLGKKNCGGSEICCQPPPPTPTPRSETCLLPNFCTSSTECTGNGGSPVAGECVGSDDVCCQISSPSDGGFDCDRTKENTCSSDKECRLQIENGGYHQRCITVPTPLPAPTNAAVCDEGLDENGKVTTDPKKMKICNEINTAVGPISTDPKDFVTRVYSIVLGLAGGIALILIILSGYRFMASQGNPEALQGARGQLISAIVGLLFIIFSFVILQVIGVDILDIPGFE